MKMRILIDQLNELSVDQKERLREWWEPELGDYFNDSDGKQQMINDMDSSGWIYYGSGSWNETKNDIFPLLSIGQMIELLKCLDQKPTTEHHKARSCIAYYLDNITDEPCDDLWLAVKQAL
jgi:hypothetical protein